MKFHADGSATIFTLPSELLATILAHVHFHTGGSIICADRCPRDFDSATQIVSQVSRLFRAVAIAYGLQCIFAITPSPIPLSTYMPWTIPIITPLYYHSQPPRYTRNRIFTFFWTTTAGSHFQLRPSRHFIFKNLCLCFGHYIHLVWSHSRYKFTLNILTLEWVAHTLASWNMALRICTS